MAGESPIPHPREWSGIRLGDIALKVGSGATPLGGEDSYLPTRDRFALVRSQNVFDRRFDAYGLAFISDEQAEGLKNVILQESDLLLNITGDGITFSRCCLVPKEILPACVNQHVAIIRVDTRRADPGYVLSYLTHPAVKFYIESFNAGGSRRAITKGHIESFELALPSLEEQRAIARILGTLDDKIELNQQMNKTLEAIARATFKSWFVDSNANSESGKVANIVMLSRDTIDPSKLPEETFDHYSIPAFDEGLLPKTETGEQIQSNKFIVPNGSVLLSKLNPRIPRVWLPNVSQTRRSVCSTEFLVAIPKLGISREYVYGRYKSPPFLDLFATLITGTTGSHQRVKPEYLLAMDVDIPAKERIEKFTDLVRPLYARVALNLEESPPSLACATCRCPSSYPASCE